MKKEVRNKFLPKREEDERPFQVSKPTATGMFSNFFKRSGLKITQK